MSFKTKAGAETGAMQTSQGTTEAARGKTDFPQEPPGRLQPANPVIFSPVKLTSSLWPLEL